MPAEWEPHDAVWLAWPSAADLWQENLPAAQAEFVAFCEAIADIDPVSGQARGEKLEILVPTVHAKEQAQQRLGHLPIRLHLLPFGDIWLRDIAPLFLLSRQDELATLALKFNGWGEKYVLPYDNEVAGRIADAAGVKQFSLPWVCEGGSLEFDGEGTCLTSRQCLLNTNRNPGLSEPQINDLLDKEFGIQKVIWLQDGLINDHTDGHIDTIARFVGPAHIAIHEAMDPQDPNSEILEAIEADLLDATDAKGRRVQLTRIPSPGMIMDDEDNLMPASYLNFYIGNSTVIVPTYGSRWDKSAVEIIATCFPNRKTVGLSARAILSGGGAFHCISQQQPRSRSKR
jgi:agmatine deiminase